MSRNENYNYDPSTKDSIARYADFLAEQDDTSIDKKALIVNLKRTITVLKSLNVNEYKTEKTNELIRVIQNSVCFRAKENINEYLYEIEINELFNKMCSSFLSDVMANVDSLSEIFGTLNTLTTHYADQIVSRNVKYNIDDAFRVIQTDELLSKENISSDDSFDLYEQALSFINVNSMHLEGKTKLNNIKIVDKLLKHIDQLNTLLNVRTQVKYVKLWIVLTIFNLVSEDEINKLKNLKDIIKTLIEMLKEVIVRSEQNTKLFDNTKFYLSYEINVTTSHIKADSIIKRLYKVSINNSNAQNLFELDVFSCVEKLLENGNDDEIKCTCELICSLCFNNNVKMYLRESDKLMNAINCVLKNTKNGITKRYCKQICYLVNTGLNIGTGKSLSASNKIFISYNQDSKDQSVSTLSQELRKIGYSVWIDEKQISKDSYDATVSGINEASIVLICYSEEYKQSVNCRFETFYASLLDKNVVFVKTQSKYSPDGWLEEKVNLKRNFDYINDSIDQLCSMLDSFKTKPTPMEIEDVSDPEFEFKGVRSEKSTKSLKLFDKFERKIKEIKEIFFYKTLFFILSSNSLNKSTLHINNGYKNDNAKEIHMNDAASFIQIQLEKVEDNSKIFYVENYYNVKLIEFNGNKKLLKQCDRDVVSLLLLQMNKLLILFRQYFIIIDIRQGDNQPLYKSDELIEKNDVIQFIESTASKSNVCSFEQNLKSETLIIVGLNFSKVIFIYKYQGSTTNNPLNCISKIDASHFGVNVEVRIDRILFEQSNTLRYAVADNTGITIFEQKKSFKPLLMEAFSSYSDGNQLREIKVEGFNDKYLIVKLVLGNNLFKLCGVSLNDKTSIICFKSSVDSNEIIKGRFWRLIDKHRQHFIYEVSNEYFKTLHICQLENDYFKEKSVVQVGFKDEFKTCFEETQELVHLFETNKCVMSKIDLHQKQHALLTFNKYVKNIFCQIDTDCVLANVKRNDNQVEIAVLNFKTKEILSHVVVTIKEKYFVYLGYSKQLLVVLNQSTYEIFVYKIGKKTENYEINLINSTQKFNPNEVSVDVTSCFVENRSNDGILLIMSNTEISSFKVLSININKMDSYDFSLNSSYKKYILSKTNKFLILWKMGKPDFDYCQLNSKTISTVKINSIEKILEINDDSFIVKSQESIFYVQLFCSDPYKCKKILTLRNANVKVKVQNGFLILLYPSEIEIYKLVEDELKPYFKQDFKLADCFLHSNYVVAHTIENRLVVVNVENVQDQTIVPIEHKLERVFVQNSNIFYADCGNPCVFDLTKLAHYKDQLLDELTKLINKSYELSESHDKIDGKMQEVVSLYGNYHQSVLYDMNARDVEDFIDKLKLFESSKMCGFIENVELLVNLKNSVQEIETRLETLRISENKSNNKELLHAIKTDDLNLFTLNAPDLNKGSSFLYELLLMAILNNSFKIIRFMFQKYKNLNKCLQNAPYVERSTYQSGEHPAKQLTKIFETIESNVELFKENILVSLIRNTSLQLLVDLNIELSNYRDDFGANILHLSAALGRNDIILYLYHENLNKLDKSGLMPIDYAALNGHASTIYLFLSLGSQHNYPSTTTTSIGTNQLKEDYIKIIKTLRNAKYIRSIGIDIKKILDEKFKSFDASKIDSFNVKGLVAHENKPILFLITEKKRSNGLIEIYVIDSATTAFLNKYDFKIDPLFFQIEFNSFEDNLFYIADKNKIIHVFDSKCQEIGTGLKCTNDIMEMVLIGELTTLVLFRQRFIIHNFKQNKQIDERLYNNDLIQFSESNIKKSYAHSFSQRNDKFVKIIIGLGISKDIFIYTYHRSKHVLSNTAQISSIKFGSDVKVRIDRYGMHTHETAYLKDEMLHLRFAIIDNENGTITIVEEMNGETSRPRLLDESCELTRLKDYEIKEFKDNCLVAQVMKDNKWFIYNYNVSNKNLEIIDASTNRSARINCVNDLYLVSDTMDNFNRKFEVYKLVNKKYNLVSTLLYPINSNPIDIETVKFIGKYIYVTDTKCESFYQIDVSIEKQSYLKADICIHNVFSQIDEHSYIVQVKRKDKKSEFCVFNLSNNLTRAKLPLESKEVIVFGCASDMLILFDQQTHKLSIYRFQNEVESVLSLEYKYDPKKAYWFDILKSYLYDTNHLEQIWMALYKPKEKLLEVLCFNKMTKNDEPFKLDMSKVKLKFEYLKCLITPKTHYVVMWEKRSDVLYYGNPNEQNKGPKEFINDELKGKLIDSVTSVGGNTDDVIIKSDKSLYYVDFSQTSLQELVTFDKYQYRFKIDMNKHILYMDDYQTRIYKLENKKLKDKPLYKIDAKLSDCYIVENCLVGHTFANTLCVFDMVDKNKEPFEIPIKNRLDKFIIRGNKLAFTHNGTLETFDLRKIPFFKSSN